MTKTKAKKLQAKQAQEQKRKIQEATTKYAGTKPQAKTSTVMPEIKSIASKKMKSKDPPKQSPQKSPSKKVSLPIAKVNPQLPTTGRSAATTLLKTSIMNSRLSKIIAPSQQTQGTIDTSKASTTTEPCESEVLKIRKATSMLFMLTDAPLLPPLDSITSSHDAVSPSTFMQPFSLEVEQTLCENFTFLASNTTDCLKVRALCIERQMNRGAEKFCIKIAANHGDLLDLKKGLEEVITALRGCPPLQPDEVSHPATIISAGMQDPGLDLLLSAIVRLNFNRILCRLQSRHAHWKCNYKQVKAARPPILKQLLDLFRDAKSSTKMDEKSKARLAVLTDKSPLLERKNAGEIVPGNPSTINTVVSIVKTIYSLWRVPHFVAAVSDRAISRPLARLANYVVVAISLIDLTKSHPWISHLNIDCVRLETLTLPQYQSTPSGLEICSRELLLTQTAIKKVCTQGRPIPESRGKSPDQIFEDLLNSKCAVHAEIQLLFHYELPNNYNNAPRVILSTKLPCVLCMLFFRIHNRYQIPQSHGHLYEKWTLPDVLKDILAAKKSHPMHTVLQKFKSVLIACIELNSKGTTQAGKGVASSESLLRTSRMCTQLSTALSFSQIVLSALADKIVPGDKFKHYPSTSARFRFSTSMLVSRYKVLVYLARGKGLVLQLGGSTRTKRPAVRTQNICLSFSTDTDLDKEEQREEPAAELIAKLWSHGIDEHPIASAGFSSEKSIDLSTLKPGEEIVLVDQRESISTDFHVRYKEEYLFIQIQKLSLKTIP